MMEKTAHSRRKNRDEMNQLAQEQGAIVLFDGVCNFCSGAVQFIIRRDRAMYFQFASLQSAVGQSLLTKHHLPTNEWGSMVLIEDGRVYTRSTAVLRICRRFDRGWKLLYACIVIPAFLRDAAYRAFAKRRYALFGQKQSCMIPTPDIRERFLDE